MRSLSSALLLAAASATCSAHEGDVAPLIVGGQLVTHSADDTTGIVSPDIVRVFGSEFLDPIGNVESTDEPGYFAAPGTFLDNSLLGVESLGQLSRWNGAGFASTTSGIVFTLAGQPNVFPGAGTTPLFNSSVGSNQTQEFDWHFFHNLVGPGSPGTVEAPDGIYLMSFRCWIEQPGQQRLTSDPFWVVYNSGGAAFESEHEAAIEWTEQNLVPSPGAASLALVAVLASGRRRR